MNRLPSIAFLIIATPIYPILCMKPYTDIHWTTNDDENVQKENRTQELFRVILNATTIDSVKKLLEKGVFINQRSNNLCYGQTPLNIAINHLHSIRKTSDKPTFYHEVIKLFIAYGALLDAPTSDNATALHYAAYLGELEVIKYLLKSRINPLAMHNDALEKTKLLLIGTTKDPHSPLSLLPKELLNTIIFYAPECVVSKSMAHKIINAHCLQPPEHLNANEKNVFTHNEFTRTKNEFIQRFYERIPSKQKEADIEELKRLLTLKTAIKKEIPLNYLMSGLGCPRTWLPPEELKICQLVLAPRTINESYQALAKEIIAEKFGLNGAGQEK